MDTVNSKDKNKDVANSPILLLNVVVDRYTTDRLPQTLEHKKGEPKPLVKQLIFKEGTLIKNEILFSKKD